jgi:tetratricopeptide (TPR) repeat protein
MAHSYFKMLACGIGVPRDIYRRFQQALEGAVAHGGWTAQIRADLAWGLHLVEGNHAEAQAHLDACQKEDPSRASPHMCQALIHVSLGRLDAALESLRLARAADPLQPALSSSEILVRLCRQEWTAAVEAGIEGVKLHPYLHFERSFYAQALEFAGDLKGALVQYGIANAIAPDLHWIRALEARCLARSGQRDAALAVAAELERIRVSTYVDAYYMAVLMEALGRRDEAFRELARAVDEYSTALYMLNVDPKINELRKDVRRFAALSARLANRGPCSDSGLAARARAKYDEAVDPPNSPLFRRRSNSALA